MTAGKRFLEPSAVPAVLARFAGKGRWDAVGYATVHDYCESADILPQITGRDGDLKNVQRPWAVKAVLGCVPPPARVLEIGGGEPIVSGFLAEIGYTVSLIDPYDGFANGPTEYERYVASFPEVEIVRGYLDRETTAFAPQTFDVIFSVSVLEHIPAEPLRSCFEAIARLLKPGGASIHCFDLIVRGVGQEHAAQNARQILQLQHELSGATVEPEFSLAEIISELKRDLETFYLSPQGHNIWRGACTYNHFPFREVVSLQTIAFKPSSAASPPVEQSGA